MKRKKGKKKKILRILHEMKKVEDELLEFKDAII